MTRPLQVAFGKHLARIDRAVSLTWDEYVDALTGAPPESEDKASRGWSVPASFREGWRDAGNLIERHALTFDYDTITPADPGRIQAALKPYEYLIYTTASHTKDRPRLRVVLPTSRPMTPDEFSAVSRRIAGDVGIELASRESHVPAQMMFLPVKKPGGTFKAYRNKGEWVDVEKVLARYPDWTDRAQWPRRKDGDSTHRAEVAIDPRKKPGVVGEFCRAYSITEAIAKFELPYKHEHGNRWTYVPGSRAEGVVIYDDDTKLHSHHDTDPARGQHNAFDLVRLHHFGGLDAGDSEVQSRDITQLQSYRAMLDYLGQDAEFAEKRAADKAEDFDVLPPAETPSLDPAKTAEADAETIARKLHVVLTTPTRTEWLLKDRLEAGIIAVMAGTRGSYKSFLALDWAMQIATAEKPRPVYVISAEGGDFDRRARAWLMRYGADVDPPSVPLYVVEKRLDLNSADGVNAVIKDCNRIGVVPGLIVLDTFSKLSGGLDENNNTDVKQFIGRLDNHFKRRGATVLIVAHTGHTDKGRPRGASAFGADTDAEYICSRTERYGLLNVTRERFKSSPELPPLTYKPEVIALGYDDDNGEPVTSLVLKPGAVEPSLNVNQPGKPRGPVQAIAWAVAQEHLAIGPGEAQDLVNAVALKLVKEGEGKRDTRKQHARRAIEGLIASGLLHMPAEDVVSLTRVVEV